MTAPAGNHHPLDSRFADQAWFAFAAIHAVLELEESFLAIGVHVVGNRGSPQRNGLVEHFLYGEIQSSPLLVADRSGAAAGADSGAEQRLVGIDVSHTAEEPLIQQRTLDGSLAAAE